MKRSSIVVLLSLLAFVFAGPTACKTKAQKEQERQAAQEERIHGVWFLDSDATIAQMPEDQQAMAGMFIQMMKIGMVFNEDNTMEMHVSMMGQKDFQEGGFEVLEVGEDQLTIQLTRDEVLDEDGNVIEEEPAKMIATFIEDDKISFKPVAGEGQDQAELDDETLILKRITKEELQEELSSSAQPSLEDLGLDMDALVPSDEDAEDADAEEADAEEADEGADAEGADAEEAVDADAADAEAADAESADAADAEEADAAE